jgi:microcystin-dependent protein
VSDQFVSEIRIFPFNFPPTGWAFCAGQLLPLSQNTALFSLLGTFYGGDGKSNFALPNLQDNTPLHVGGNQPGQGLSTYYLGEQTGVPYVTLIQTEMPMHIHNLQASTQPGEDPAPGGEALGRSVGANLYQSTTGGQVFMAPNTTSITGSSLPHNNMQPYLALNFCIALQGIYPPRT